MPFTRFFIAVGAQTAVVLGIFRLLAPNAFFAEAAQPWKILLWSVLIGLPLSLFEYLYHRYMLHSAVFPFISSMHRAHTTHHSLTYVKAPVSPLEPARLVEVSSDFSVEEKHQEESMMFPLWSLSVFFALFIVLIALPLKLILPGQPIVLSLIASVTVYYGFYEVWHALLHLPFERFWQPLMEGRWTRRVFRRMYSFHLMHHWRPTSNLAIVGFWGIALWDHAFRTHRRPENLPLNGAEVNYNDARLAKPLWPIRVLDRWQSGLYRASRAVERFFGRIFLGWKSG